jgi:DNA repair protein RadC
MKEYKKKIETFSIIKNKTNIPSAKISKSKDGYDYIKNNIYDESIDVYESFYMLLLNRANNVTGFIKISQGGITGTVVDIKLITKYAINELSNSIIIAHNHPSGEKKPSNLDRKITNKIKKGLDFFEINLLDHLIITSENGYYSFKDEGDL